MNNQGYFIYSVSGYGLYHYMFMSSDSKHSEEKSSLFVKLLHVILSLILCQFVENVKPSQTNVVFFYFFTFAKFCVLTFSVTMVTKLFLNYDKKQNKNDKNSW